MQPVRIEPVNGSGWTFTTITATVFLGAAYYTVLGWTGPAGTLGERIGATAIMVCAGLVLPFGVNHVRRARRHARRRAEVLATGARTIATVTAVVQTAAGGEGHNPTVQITLRVMAPDRTSRSAWARYELPIPMIVALRPGTLLPVVLDLDDPLSVVIDWSGYRAGAEPELPEVKHLIAQGSPMAAVKAYRDLTGAPLAEARDAVDRITRALAREQRRATRDRDIP